jgi:tetratricopeptide (TPR) repeat protein
VYPAGVGYYDYDYDPPVYALAPSYDPPARTDATAIATEPARPRAAATYNPDGAAPANPAASIADSSSPFVRQGEEAFKARDYNTAVRHWRHALVDEPKNATLVMMLAQAHFAAGEYDEAAGATQAAMALMPPEKWGVVVENYAELYSDSQDYVDQLQALEKAIKEDTKNPALRFIVGFHYGYLGYPVEAVRELDKLLELAPKDQAGRKLRDLMAEGAKKKSPAGAEPPPEPKPPE